MTISELIERLEALKAEHGDVECLTVSEGMYEPAVPWYGHIDIDAYVRSATGIRRITAVVI